MSWPPTWARSIRVRLTLTYSLALFVVGTFVLAGIYLGLRQALDDEPFTQRYFAQNVFTSSDGDVVVMRVPVEREVRTVEQLANERALEQLRTWSFGALGALVVLSLGIGWVVAGRVLRPIGRISDVARDIQATDMSRRIDLDGPDDELTRLADTFDDMLDRLDRAFESQRRFVHEASHELRNPLATIRTNIDVALADPDASVDDLRQTAEVVDRSTQRIGSVVDDLLAFARSEIPDREERLIDIDDLVHEVGEEFAAPAEAAGIQLRIFGSTGQHVRGEPEALRRVVANLLANAIEHAPSSTSVDIDVADEADGVRICVSDHGSGVGADERHTIFRRGWRSERSRDLRPAGSGLGLSIVQQVVREHGGRVHVEQTDASGGARFVVRLPAVATTGSSMS